VVTGTVYVTVNVAGPDGRESMIHVKSPSGSGIGVEPAVTVIVPCTRLPAGFGHVSTTVTLRAFDTPVFVTVIVYEYVIPSPAFVP
jgi:hypothetical protein